MAAHTTAKAKKPAPSDWPAGTVFTIGHSTLPIEQFIETLRTYAIVQLIDVRKIPRSRHNPQYGSEALAESLGDAGIEYRWMHALGGLHHSKPDSPNGGWRNKSFRGYADYMQTDAFRHGVEELIAISRDPRTAIMCAEAVPWRCHRSLVADALCVRGVAAAEILSETNCRLHKLTPFAHVDGTQITYPPD
jgi:uncharacterized protein (DUF488 family)